MRYGKGTDLPGLNDPRGEQVGVIFVEPEDSHEEILTAILAQEKLDREQIIIDLPQQNRAFQYPEHFDDLMQMRHQIQGELIFITPPGPGPAELARQRRFSVFSSAESFVTDFLGVPPSIPTQKPDTTDKAKAAPQAKKGWGLNFGAFGRGRSAPSAPVKQETPPPVTPRTNRPGRQPEISTSTSRQSERPTSTYERRRCLAGYPPSRPLQPPPAHMPEKFNIRPSSIEIPTLSTQEQPPTSADQTGIWEISPAQLPPIPEPPMAPIHFDQEDDDALPPAAPSKPLTTPVPIQLPKPKTTRKLAELQPASMPTPAVTPMLRKLGLIIGVNHYQDSTFHPLNFAENDAKTLAQYLINTKGGKWKPQDVQLVQGLHATKELTEALITQLCMRAATENNVVLLYFAGQAFVDERTGDGYLALANTRYQDTSTALNVRILIQMIYSQSRANQVLCIFDTFQVGQLWKMRRTSPYDSMPLIGTATLSLLRQFSNRLVLCSCRGNEEAAESGTGTLGMFAHELLLGLCGHAAESRTMNVTLPKLYAYIFQNLPEQHQPQLFGQSTTPFVLVGDAPLAPPQLSSSMENVPTNDTQTIYISPEANLTTLREFLETIPSRKITLVIPDQTQLRSHVAWKLLYAQARELGKEVLIVSSNPQIRSIAHTVKFKVIHSLETHANPQRTRTRISNHDRSSAGRNKIYISHNHPTLPMVEDDTPILTLNILHTTNQLSIPKPVHYRNAKVVLVGDSGVGKSGLALVLTSQSFAPTESTHGRHVWQLDQQEVMLDGKLHERREIWLWDLAGQRDYRLIHQLHLHEATIALIVFDPARDTDPFAGVRHWHRALRLAQQAGRSRTIPLKIFLVAARMDRGGRSVSQARIDELVRELGCTGYIETSAKDGRGIAELSQTIRSALDWTTLPTVTSTKLLQTIKTFVQQEQRAEHILRTIGELYQGFLRISDAPPPSNGLQQQFKTILGCLGALGNIRQLGFGDLVLLQPERLDAYASALAIAVRNEADGLGAISEERVRLGQFTIPQEERLEDRAQEQLLLIAMIEELVRNELVLREGGLLLLPSQSTAEHPEHTKLKEKQTVTFTITSPVPSTYTTLVVRLAQCGIFQKQGLWQNVVTYTTQLGSIFGLLLTPQGEERAKLGLFFDESAREEIRFLFEDFVLQHLKQHMGGTIQRQRRFVCSVCGNIFTETQVNNRRSRGHTFIPCSICETKVSLHDGSERLSTSTMAHHVKTMQQTADIQRDRQAAATVVQGKRETGDFDVFLCHNDPDKVAVRRVGEELKQHGILPWLDEWELRPGLPWQRVLEEQIRRIKSAAVFVGASGIGPWQRHELEAFLREFVNRGVPVIPVLLSDAPKEPKLPVFLKGMAWVDFRIREPNPMERLIWGITGERC